MIIFKDILTGDDMFSDTHKYEEFMDCFYKVPAKMVTTSSSGIDERLIGGNKSAEDTEVEVEESSSSKVLDLVDECRLFSFPAFSNKKSLMVYAKDYVKAVVNKMQENEEDQCKIDEFKASAPAGVKYLCKNVKDFEVFSGESQNPDGNLGFLNYEEDGVTPYMLFFKYGLREEKC